MLPAYVRLSTLTTESPARASLRTTAEPMKPAPPVTRMGYCVMALSMSPAARCGKPARSGQYASRGLLVPEQIEQVRAVPAVAEWLGERTQLVRIDETRRERDFFRAPDLQALPLLDRLDEAGGFLQRFVRPGIQPDHATSELLQP